MGKTKPNKAIKPSWPTKNVRGFTPIHNAYIQIGWQVLWVPDDVESIHDVREGGVRRGFITMFSKDKSMVWCRFVKSDSLELESVESSEKVMAKDLCWWPFTGREKIAEIMGKIGIQIPADFLSNDKKKK